METEELLAAAAKQNAPQHGVHLDIGTYGDIGSLHWAHNAPPLPGHALCDVAYGARFSCSHQAACRNLQSASVAIHCMMHLGHALEGIVLAMLATMCDMTRRDAGGDMIRRDAGVRALHV